MQLYSWPPPNCDNVLYIIDVDHDDCPLPSFVDANSVTYTLDVFTDDPVDLGTHMIKVVAILGKGDWGGKDDLTAEFTFNIDVYTDVAPTSPNVTPPTVTDICEDSSQTLIIPQTNLQSSIMKFYLGSGLVHDSWYEDFFNVN